MFNNWSSIPWKDWELPHIIFIIIDALLVLFVFILDVPFTKK